jgi:hypothetical protein
VGRGYLTGIWGENGRGVGHRDTGTRAEEERGWLAPNKWLTIINSPSPCFSKVVIPKGFKFFRMNTWRSVDSRWVMGDVSLYKSNCCGPEDDEGAGAGAGVRKVGGVEFTKKSIII